MTRFPLINSQAIILFGHALHETVNRGNSKRSARQPCTRLRLFIVKIHPLRVEKLNIYHIGEPNGI